MSSHDKASKPFDLVYFDLWTYPQLTYNNEKYLLSIVDDFNRFIWIFHLYINGQCANVFFSFTKMIEKQCNVPLKAFQIDVGT